MAGPGVYLVARALALTEAGRLAEAEATARPATTAPSNRRCSKGRGGSPSCSAAPACSRAAWKPPPGGCGRRPSSGASSRTPAALGFGGLVHGAGAARRPRRGRGRARGPRRRAADADSHDGRRHRARPRRYTWLRGEHGRALEMLRAADAGVEGGQFALAAACPRPGPAGGAGRGSRAPRADRRARRRPAHAGAARGRDRAQQERRARARRSVGGVRGHRRLALRRRGRHAGVDAVRPRGTPAAGVGGGAARPRSHRTLRRRAAAPPSKRPRSPSRCHQARAGGGDARGAGADQSRDRRDHRGVDAHGREPPPACLREARRERSRSSSPRRSGNDA